MKKYNVGNMSCASCATKLENALKQNSSVQKVNVNFATKTLNVTANDYDEVENIASKLGFTLQDVQLHESHYQISNMNCASCAQSIEKKLNTLHNVSNATVSFATKKAYVTYYGDENEIIETIHSLGYTIAKIKENNIDLILLMILGSILMFISMLPMFHIKIWHVIDPHHNAFNNAILQLVLTTIIIFIRKDLLRSGFKKLINGIPNMDSLIFLSVSVAYLYSVFEIMFSNFNSHKMLYFESAGMILVFVGIGKYIEEKSKQKSFSAMKSLMNLAPKQALLKSQEIKNVTDIEIDDIIVVKPGDIIPLDGKITFGSTFIDEQFLTGEALSVEKSVGDFVFAGTQNNNGYIEIIVTKKSDKSVLSTIIELVEHVQSTKAPIAKVADVISGYFVFGILILSIISFITWLFIRNDLHFAIHIVISILVIACPCALGLATPIAILVGSTKASQHQILFKKASAIQALSEIDYVVFDKTGTLTSSTLNVTTFENYSQLDLLSIVASIENASEHPLAKTIIQYAHSQNKTFIPLDQFKHFPGKGISGVIDGTRYFLGNMQLMLDNNIQLHNDNYLKLLEKGITTLFISDESSLLGIIGITSTIQKEAHQMLQYLKKHNIQSMIISGDNYNSVKHISHQLQINDFKAEVSPEQKHLIVSQLKSKYKVAMVGDGINDAVALTTAHVGVAIGSGSEIATNSADIILLRSNILDLAIAIDLAKKTMKKVYSNLFWAFLYNTIGIILATGLLIPFNIMLHPMFAAFAMSISSISVVLNALQLFHYKFKK